MPSKSIYSNAKKQKEREDYEVAHGKTTGNAFEAGVRVFMPLDKYHNPLPTGSNYVTEHGEITLYDSKYRVIDSEYFNHQVELHKKRKEDVLRMVKGFLESGDALTKSVIGYYYDWLLPGQPVANTAGYNKLVAYVMNDGFNLAQAQATVNALIPFDGRPNTINTFTNPSDNFTNCLNKLMTICKYVGVIFTGHEVHPTPAPPSGGNDNLFDPYGANANFVATGEARNEVASTRRFTQQQSDTVLR